MYYSIHLVSRKLWFLVELMQLISLRDYMIIFPSLSATISNITKMLNIKVGIIKAKEEESDMTSENLHNNYTDF